MAAYDNGFPDENFQQPVSQTLHCIICTNVFKDPVMCPQNQHLFCRVCITRHLVNFNTCPTCMQPLAIQTLSEAPRAIKNLLAELQIRCEFFNRGCQQFVELGALERHVEECGFAPTVCSNEGCGLELNRSDLIHHETELCERRRVECDRCNDIQEDLRVLKEELNDKLVRTESNIEMIKEQLENQAVYHGGLGKDVVEMKKSLNAMTKQMERLTQLTGALVVHVGEDEETKVNAKADETSKELKIFVAGGNDGGHNLDSAEMFSLSKRTWARLQRMRERRSSASSVVYNNNVMVAGGTAGTVGTDSVETLRTNAAQDIQSVPWENSPVKLHDNLWGHSCVVYNEHLIEIGGYDEGKGEYSDSIIQVSLVPPYTSKRLRTMPQKKAYYGVGVFDDKIVIVGGREAYWPEPNLSNVLMYDITKDECKELAPLPYPVGEMATVTWGENVIILGGIDTDYKPLNKVAIYNVKTQESHMLPDMKYKRRGCVAVVAEDTVIVMGGMNEEGNDLKSVECFKFDRYTWEELPEMNDARSGATAIVC